MLFDCLVPTCTPLLTPSLPNYGLFPTIPSCPAYHHPVPVAIFSFPCRDCRPIRSFHYRDTGLHFHQQKLACEVPSNHGMLLKAGSVTNDAFCRNAIHNNGNVHKVNTIIPHMNFVIPFGGSFSLLLLIP